MKLRQSCRRLRKFDVSSYDKIFLALTPASRQESTCYPKMLEKPILVWPVVARWVTADVCSSSCPPVIIYSKKKESTTFYLGESKEWLNCSWCWCKRHLACVPWDGSILIRRESAISQLRIWKYTIHFKRWKGPLRVQRVEATKTKF